MEMDMVSMFASFVTLSRANRSGGRLYIHHNLGERGRGERERGRGGEGGGISYSPAKTSSLNKTSSLKLTGKES